MSPTPNWPRDHCFLRGHGKKPNIEPAIKNRRVRYFFLKNIPKILIERFLRSKHRSNLQIAHTLRVQLSSLLVKHTVEQSKQKQAHSFQPVSLLEY